MNQVINNNKNIKTNLNMLTITAMLSAISYILAFIEFPVPLSPSFAKMDFSDFPALIGALVFGPIEGVIIEFIKNVLQLLTTTTAGIGEFANFIIGSSFVLSAGVIYKLQKAKKSPLFSCAFASIIMGIMAVFINYLILLPMFEKFMPINQIISSFANFIPFIKTKLDVVLYNALPVNILKGLIISIFTVIIYKKLFPILKNVKYIGG